MTTANHVIQHDTAAFADMVRKHDDDVTMSAFEFQSLLDKIAKLQEAYDAYVETIIADIRAHGKNFDMLKSIYTKRWFEESQFSTEALQKIATVLLDVTESVHPGYPLWVDASYGNLPITPVEVPKLEKKTLKKLKSDQPKNDAPEEE